MTHRYNYLGQELFTVYPKLRNDNYGSIDKNGEPHPYWLQENIYVDSYGFDKSFVNENGLYLQKITLPEGHRLCRYGHEGGRFTTDTGTPYSMLGLPYKPETLEYHEYMVINQLEVCIVEKGRVYPMFDSPGGAMQYMHSQAIWKEIEDKKIKEDFSWIKN